MVRVSHFAAWFSTGVTMTKTKPRNIDQFSRIFHSLLKNDTLAGAMPIYTNIRNASEKKSLWETEPLLVLAIALVQ